MINYIIAKQQNPKKYPVSSKLMNKYRWELTDILQKYANSSPRIVAASYRWIGRKYLQRYNINENLYRPKNFTPFPEQNFHIPSLLE